MNIDELLELTENCKKEIAELKWHEDDVRFSFFGLYYSNIYNFYIGKTTFHLAELIGNGKVQFTQDVLYFKDHAQRLYEIQEHPMLSAGFHIDLNKNIVLSCWTSFELSILLIFDYLVDDLEYETIIKKLNAKLVKAISSMEEKSKTIIIDILKKSSFVPLARKFNFITNRIKNSYDGDIKEDRKFIDFLGKLRNSIIHSNGYYRGKEFSYKFNDVEFIFKNKEIFEQKGNNQDIYLEIGIEIKEIFKRLTNCISDIENIPYPNDGQNIA